MDDFRSLDIAIFCFICILLIISVIGYWFGLKALEKQEHFDKCTNLKCDAAFVNERLKNAHIMIQYLEDCSAEIAKNIPLNKLQQEIEPYEDIYISLTAIEEKIRTVSNQQSFILKVWNSIKNTSFGFDSKKLTDITCFQVKTPDECNGEEIKKILKKLASKLEEISYQTGLYHFYMMEIQKMMADYNERREKAIKVSSQQASSLMSDALGTPINIDLSKNFNSPPNPAIAQAVKSGNPAELAQLALNNPDIMNQVSNIDPAKAVKNSEKMYEKNGPNSGASFGVTGNDLLSSGFNKSKDPKAANAKYKEGQKKKNIPSGFF
jgi:hypothetical protein